MGFDVLEAEFFHEITRYIFAVHAFAAGVNVNAHEAAVREGVDADVRLHNHHKSTPTAGIFDAVVVSPVYLRFSENLHADFLGEFFEAFHDQLFVIEFFEIAAITVQRQMLAEVASFFVFSFEDVGQHFKKDF